MNESQKRSVLFSFLDIHRRLADMEAMLAQSLTTSPFSQYVNDLSPTERRVVQDYFNRLRSTMRGCLQEADIPLEVHRTSLRWSLQCGMIFLNIAVAEISPDRLRGYGPLDADGKVQALKIQQELTRLIDRIANYLRQGLGQDLPQRLARLEAAPANVEMLQVLDRIITRWGLVEFRPQLDLIVRRLEAPRFEIAVFGRVSSGKSSLLNHIIGGDVLPVGVTPITAVPTRLVSGDQAAAFVSFAEQPPRTIPLEELGNYASEEGNPGNQKHITEILVQLPAARLREGIVLVDTPGIGSLARSGSAETFAYLPHCDLGVVLIDAASALTPEDMDLLRLLYEAGVPAQVLLSKADLLTPADRQRAVDYIRENLRRELGLDLPVHPVSTVGANEELLFRWFEDEVEPQFARHQALLEASLRRKINLLRESVLAQLQTLATRQEGGSHPGGSSASATALRQYLDKTDEEIRQVQARCRDWTTDEPALVKIALSDAAQAVVNCGQSALKDGQPVLGVLQHVLAQRDKMAQELVASLQQTLIRSLEALRQSAPLVEADHAAMEGLVFRGLPILDLAAHQEKFRCTRPWWASLLPRLALWATRRKLEKHLGPFLQEQVELHDRQLQAWVKACVGQLVELYEAQAELYREQARRLTAGRDEEPAVKGDLDDLHADLRELQQLSVAEPTMTGAGANPSKVG
jgi:GTP-binding protein EngB required for normal cell division